MLLFSALLIYMLDGSVKEENIEIINEQIQENVDDTYISSCLKLSLEKGLVFFAQRGGIIFTNKQPQNVHSTIGMDFSIYNKKNEFLNIDQAQNELRDYLYLDLPICLNHSLDNDTIIEVLILPGMVTSTINLNNSKSYLGKLNIKLFELIDDIHNNLKIENEIDSILLDGYDRMVSPLDKDTLLYSFNVHNETLFGRPFVFNMVYKLDDNSAPTLEPIPDFFVENQNDFVYTIKAADEDLDEVTFSSSSQYVNVDSKTGIMKINFPELGEYDVVVTASDPYGLSDSMDVEFVLQ